MQIKCANKILSLLWPPKYYREINFENNKKFISDVTWSFAQQYYHSMRDYLPNIQLALIKLFFFFLVKFAYFIKACAKKLIEQWYES